jgi:hypothetical protein
MARPKPGNKKPLKPLTKNPAWYSARLKKAKLAATSIPVLRSRVKKANAALDAALHKQEAGGFALHSTKRTPLKKGIDKGGPSKSTKTGRSSGWHKKGRPTSKRKSGGSK